MVLRARAILGLVLLSLAPATGADLPTEPRGRPAAPAQSDLDALTPQPGAPSDGEGWWQEVVRRFPGCAALSDGCRICTKEQSGFTCSNISIACQPKEWACSR